ncbi:MAG: DUF1684 domain-containing protein [Trueperaceae bacterium]|nr:DUF1684 domain-containing protein [Trueperaceae bacterium]
MSGYVSLLDYRRRVHELYARIRRAGTASPVAFADFVATRDALFGRHPQSPLPEGRRAAFAGLAYHPYDPGLRFVVPLDVEVPRTRHEMRLADDGVVALERFARVEVPFPTGTARLSLFWIGGYGGGIFLPFRDATNGATSYGGGRYLLDTIKGADLGYEGADLGYEGADLGFEGADLGYEGADLGYEGADLGFEGAALRYDGAGAGTSAGGIVLDFNYAYHPSCAYDARWDCPLAPPENRLDVAVNAGERLCPSVR